MRKICFLIPGLIFIVMLSSGWAEEFRVEVKEVPESNVVWVRTQTPIQRMGSTMGRVFGDIFRYLGPKGVKPTGPPVAVYYSSPDSDPVDFEVCVPVPPGVTGEGKVKVKTLSGGTMASLIYVGPYREIGSAYSILMKWIEKSEYRPSGPCREVYLKGPEETSDPKEYRTEILKPISGT
ncbi:MAG: GyrI-like domain-containing protein [Candidatus Auribacterota bacterium]|nr:GyrI-like domain-containing protein [Candidatus Auribacterota bacterium]